MQIIPFASLMNGCLLRPVRREGTKWPKTRKLDKHKCRRQEQTEEREGHEKCNARQQELQEVKREREREMGKEYRRENKQNYFSAHW